MSKNDSASQQQVEVERVDASDGFPPIVERCVLWQLVLFYFLLPLLGHLRGLLLLDPSLIVVGWLAGWQPQVLQFRQVEGWDWLPPVEKGIILAVGFL